MATRRIAFVTETYPPEINGVAMSVGRFVGGLRARGHSLQLVRPRQAADGIGNRDEDLILTRGARIPRYPNLQMGFCSPRRLRSLWAAARPDIVHVATEGPLGFSALTAALKLGIPVTTSFHTNFHSYSKHYGIGWLKAPLLRYLRHFHNRAACTMVPTKAMQAELEAQGFERLHTVSRGVDTTLFSPAKRDASLRTAWGVGEHRLAVIHVGRLAGEKNPDLAARAFAGLQQQRPDARMIWVGDGPLRGQLQQHYPQHIFCGMQIGDDLARHYASADVFIFPSLTETYGNVIPEAMASGLAVVAFDYAAAHEHIRHTHNGLLAPFADERAFCELSLQMRDGELCAQLGGRAAASVGALTWQRTVEHLERILLHASAPQEISQREELA